MKNSELKLGKEFIDKDGFICYRLPHKSRISKHRYLYQEYHNCEVTPNEVVIFLNGNNRDFSRDNLYKITRGELVVLNHCYGGTNDDPDKTLALITLARIKIKRVQLAQKAGLTDERGNIVEDLKSARQKYAVAHREEIRQRANAWQKEKRKDPVYREMINKRRRDKRHLTSN